MREMRFKYLKERNMKPFYKTSVDIPTGPIQVKLIDGLMPLCVLVSQSVELIFGDNNGSNTPISAKHMESVEKKEIAFVINNSLYIHLDNLLDIIIKIIVKRFDDRVLDSIILEQEIKKINLILSYAGGYEMFKFADLFLPISFKFRMHLDTIDSLEALKENASRNDILLKWLHSYDDYPGEFTKGNDAISFSQTGCNISRMENHPDIQYAILINDGGNYGAPGAHEIDSLTLIALSDYQ